MEKTCGRCNYNNLRDNSSSHCMKCNKSERSEFCLSEIDAYRDLGTVEELQEIKQKLADGRMVELPIAIKDTVYSLDDESMFRIAIDKIIELIVYGFNIDKNLKIHIILFSKQLQKRFIVPIEYIGKTVFLTKTNAEKAFLELEGLK